MIIRKDEILKAISSSMKPIMQHLDYSHSPGIYAFMLKEECDLKGFTIINRALYVGIAKDSLAKRDLGNHFNSKSTGRSTLRRSIGAILKEELVLTCFSRNGTTNKKEVGKYVFNIDGENALTEWMVNNIEVGYWEDTNNISYSQLRSLEKEVILEFKPALDLDKRTKGENKLASILEKLRERCRNEALENALNNKLRTS